MNGSRCRNGELQVAWHPRGLRVLAYQRIVADERFCNASRYYVHASVFRRQLELLDRWGYTPITLHDYKLFLGGELNLPRKPIILTFDNGFDETYCTALPILREFGFKAVVFVPGNRKLCQTRTAQCDSAPCGSLLSDQHILELCGRGFEIGAHSMSHRQLQVMPGERAQWEIAESKNQLELLLNSPVISFAYHSACRVDEATKGIVADAGYAFGCSLASGPLGFGADAFEVRRIPALNSAGSMGFAMRVLGPYLQFEKLNLKARGRAGFPDGEKESGNIGNDEETGHVHPVPEMPVRVNKGSGFVPVAARRTHMSRRFPPQ